VILYTDVLITTRKWGGWTNLPCSGPPTTSPNKVDRGGSYTFFSKRTHTPKNIPLTFNM
jgi:hypothetical protein